MVLLHLSSFLSSQVIPEVQSLVLWCLDEISVLWSCIEINNKIFLFSSCFYFFFVLPPLLLFLFPLWQELGCENISRNNNNNNKKVWLFMLKHPFKFGGLPRLFLTNFVFLSEGSLGIHSSLVLHVISIKILQSKAAINRLWQQLINRTEICLL